MAFKMLAGIVIILAMASLTQCSIMQKIEVDMVDNTTELVERWYKFQNQFERTVESVLKQALPFILGASSEADLSDKCMDSLTKLIFAVRKMKPWALKMIDSIGKPPSGVLDGSLTAVGAFDQCLDIEVNPENEDGFMGQYCALNLRPPLPPKPHFYRMDQELESLRNFTPSNSFVGEIKSQAASFYLVAIRVGVCVPSHCTPEDVQKIGTAVAEQLGFFARVTSCQTKEPMVVDEKQLIVICVILVFIITVFSATLMQVYFYKDTIDIGKNPQLKWQLIRSFSIPYNVTNVLDTRVSPEAAPLQCLHGMKFISITWVLLGHTYLYVNWQSFSNLKNAQEYGKDFAFQTIVNASVAVDTFFFISGVLLCNITVKLVAKHGPSAYNVPIYIARRLWRLIPAALLTVGIVILVPIFGSGPFWHEVMDDIVSVCRRNWWAIALSVNNFLHPREMCLQQTWYIACDLQLYICSLLFLWLFFKKKVYGYSMAALMIVISIIAPGVVTLYYRHPPTMLLPNADIDQRLEMWYNNYFLPYAHSGPYALGLLLGYYLAKHQKITIPMWLRILGWTTAFVFSTTILYSTVKWNRPNVPTVAESVAYAALHRTGWALSITWLTLVCATGYGGVINTILAWKALIPFSKLTYLIYLLHFIIMWSQSASLRSTIDARHAIGVWMFFGNMCISILISFLVKIFFDSPLQELEKVILTRLAIKKEKNVDTTLNATKMNVEVNNLAMDCNGKAEFNNLNNGNTDAKNTRL